MTREDGAVGDRIRRARQAAGYSQEALAAAMPTSRRNINRWENEGVIPKDHYASRLAELIHYYPRPEPPPLRMVTDGAAPSASETEDTPRRLGALEASVSEIREVLDDLLDLNRRWFRALGARLDIEEPPSSDEEKGA